MKSSHLESMFALYWRCLNAPPLKREYYFAKPRMWRFDFADPDKMIAIELDGGLRKRIFKRKDGTTYESTGRHNTAEGYESDCEKFFEAARQGWRVFRLTKKMININNVEKIIEVLKDETQHN